MLKIRSKPLMLSALLVVGLGTCVAIVTVEAESTKPAPIELDFSRGHTVSDIALPKGVTWIEDTAVIKNSTISLRAPGNHTYIGYVGQIFLDRHGPDIRTINFHFDKESIAEVYKHATALAREWGLPPDDFDRWKVAAEGGHWDGTIAYAYGNNQVPAVSIEIRQTFDRTGTMPGFVSFSLSWPLPPGTTPK